MTITREMPEIDAALNAESWELLQNGWPELAAAVAEEAARKTPPNVIYRHVLNIVGLHREALARRCLLASRHLQNGAS